MCARAGKIGWALQLTDVSAHIHRRLDTGARRAYGGLGYRRCWNTGTEGDRSEEQQGERQDSVTGRAPRRIAGTRFGCEFHRSRRSTAARCLRPAPGPSGSGAGMAGRQTASPTKERTGVRAGNSHKGALQADRRRAPAEQPGFGRLSQCRAYLYDKFLPAAEDTEGVARKRERVRRVREATRLRTTT